MRRRLVVGTAGTWTGLRQGAAATARGARAGPSFTRCLATSTAPPPSHSLFPHYAPDCALCVALWEALTIRLLTAAEVEKATIFATSKGRKVRRIQRPFTLELGGTLPEVRHPPACARQTTASPPRSSPRLALTVRALQRQLEIVYEEWGNAHNPVVLLFPSLSVGSHARSGHTLCSSSCPGGVLDPYHCYFMSRDCATDQAWTIRQRAGGKVRLIVKRRFESVTERHSCVCTTAMLGPSKGISTEKFRVICPAGLGSPFGSTSPLVGPSIARLRRGLPSDTGAGPYRCVLFVSPRASIRPRARPTTPPSLRSRPEVHDTPSPHLRLCVCLTLTVMVRWFPC
jgi:hypothetical protein